MTIIIPADDVFKIARDEFDGTTIELKSRICEDMPDETIPPPVIHVDNSVTVIVTPGAVKLGY